MPDILVKPIRYSSPVGERTRLVKQVVFKPLNWFLTGVKNVQFANSGKPQRCYKIENLDSYTKRERDACFYGKAEYRRMRVNRNLAEKQLGKGKPLEEDEDVAIGLETSRDSELRAICSVQSVRSVLIEQEIQKWETQGNPEQAISDVYFHTSFASRLDARERALRLESSIMPGRWLPESRSEGSLKSNSNHGESSSSNDAPPMPIRGGSTTAPAMPKRKNSLRGLGEGPVRVPSFSENDFDDDSEHDDSYSDDYEQSLNDERPPSPPPLSSFVSTSSNGSPRMPRRQTSITLMSSSSSISSSSSCSDESDDDDSDYSWANSQQRAAGTISSFAT